MKLVISLILAFCISGCGTQKIYEKDKQRNKTEKENKPLIQFKNPFTDDVDIEDILGR